MKTSFERAREICYNNLYLIDESEVKKMLVEWQQDKVKILNLEKKIKEFKKQNAKK